MKRWLIWFGGALLAVAVAILGRDGRQLKRVEATRDRELASRTKAGQLRAERLNKKAETHRQNADKAAAETVKRLEKISETDQDMDDLLSAWRSERVRQQSG